MSLDFATEALFTVASCNCVSADSRGISNLVSRDQKKKQDGFQGERFVRTPVTIQFQFYVPISLHQVQFRPHIGRQCAKVIQLWTSNTWKLAKKENGPCEPISNRNEAEGFKKSGTIVLSSPSNATFLNRGYRPHPRLDLLSKDAGAQECFTHGNLSCITALRITILYMLYGSIPSLSSVRIWGRPARSCSATLSKEILEINSKTFIKDNPSLPQKLHIYDSSSNVFDHGSDKSQPNEDKHSADSSLVLKQCPKEFQDPITFEQMRAPVVLPSGHTIDRTTLDRHIKSQSEMGNIATDPFTGIPFTSTNKPQPNVDLKLRMDSYFLKQSKCQVLNQKVPTPMKRPVETVGEKLIESPTTCAPVKKLKLSSFSDRNTRASDHLTTLTQSLNAALNRVRDRKTKVLSVDKIANTNSTLYCSKCDTFLSSDVVRYRLACSHVACISCLKMLRTENSNCAICLTPVVFSNVERIHI